MVRQPAAGVIAGLRQGDESVTAICAVQTKCDVPKYGASIFAPRISTIMMAAPVVAAVPYRYRRKAADGGAFGAVGFDFFTG